MQKLKQKLNELIGITDAEWTAFSQKLQEQIFKTKELLVREGSVSPPLFFIKSGLLRTYHLHDGKEISTYFACDNQLISSFSSFITQTRSIEYIEAIEDTIVYALSSQALNELYKEAPKFEKLGRILAEQNYLCVFDRTLVMQTKTGKEKYLDFMANNEQKIIQRVPLRMIATFLGIVSESLSRIRKEISIT